MRTTTTTDRHVASVTELRHPVLICRFSDNEFAFLHLDCYHSEGDDYETRHIFRGNIDNDRMYESMDEALDNMRRMRFGGPQGDLDLDLTNRPYEVVSVFYIDHMEDDAYWDELEPIVDIR